MSETSTNGTATVEPDAEKASKKKQSVDLEAYAKAQAEATARLEKIVKDLAAVMSRASAPAAAIASPNRSTPEQDAHLQKAIDRAVALKELSQAKLDNGDIVYSLPVKGLRENTAALFKDPEAFVERGLHGHRQWIEVTGSGDRALAASMLFAKQKYGDDGIVIHPADKHFDRVIEAAVKAGLNIANTDSRTVQAVETAKQRQAHPLLRDRSQYERENVTFMEVAR